MAEINETLRVDKQPIRIDHIRIEGISHINTIRINTATDKKTTTELFQSKYKQDIHLYLTAMAQTIILLK